MLPRFTTCLGILIIQSLCLCCFAEEEKSEVISPQLAKKFGKVVTVKADLKFVSDKLGIPDYYLVSIYSCDGKELSKPIEMKLSPWSRGIGEKVELDKLAKKSGTRFKIIGFEDIHSEGQPEEIFKFAPNESIQTISFRITHRFVFFKIEALGVEPKK